MRVYSHSYWLVIFVQPIAAECWRGRGGKLSRILGKKTQYLMKTLYLLFCSVRYSTISLCKKNENNHFIFCCKAVLCRWFCLAGPFKGTVSKKVLSALKGRSLNIIFSVRTVYTHVRISVRCNS